MIDNEVHTFIGFLRLYQGNNYSIILTLEKYKIRYAILDSQGKEVTDIKGVDWYDLVDVMKTMQLLECEAAYVNYIDTDMFSNSDIRYVDTNMIKRKLNEMYGRGEQND